jgi:hypothetical protein
MNANKNLRRVQAQNAQIQHVLTVLQSYSGDQPRNENGEWTSTGGGGKFSTVDKFKQLSVVDKEKVLGLRKIFDAHPQSQNLISAIDKDYARTGGSLSRLTKETVSGILEYTPFSKGKTAETIKSLQQTIAKDIGSPLKPRGGFYKGKSIDLMGLFQKKFALS